MFGTLGITIIRSSSVFEPTQLHFDNCIVSAVGTDKWLFSRRSCRIISNLSDRINIFEILYYSATTCSIIFKNAIINVDAVAEENGNLQLILSVKLSLSVNDFGVNDSRMKLVNIVFIKTADGKFSVLQLTTDACYRLKVLPPNHYRLIKLDESEDLKL